MTTITLPRAVVEQALETIEGLTRDRLFTAEWAGKHGATVATLRAALAQPDPQDPELSAALGWPGGISDPVLDRKTLLQQVAALRAALAQQAGPVQVAERERIAAQWDGCVTHQLDAFGPVNIGASIRAGELVEAQQAEPVQEPVAWSGYDLDGMVEAFSRVIEAHYQRANPFQNPIDMDAQMALRILRGFIPAMKAYTAPPQRKPLPKHDQHCVDVPGYGLMAVRLVRAVERAHGIKE